MALLNPLRLENWCALPTPLGEFRLYDTGDECVRLVSVGDVREQGSLPLLRVHSSCLASEVFGAIDCDCADQLRESMKLIAMNGRGIIIHLCQEGRGHGLSNKISAIGAMQRDGLDTVEAFESLGLIQDVRTYRVVIDILDALGLRKVRLLTNNPAKSSFLRQHGILVEIVNTHPTIREENVDYLRAKQTKLGHSFSFDAAEACVGAICFYHSDQPYGELSNFSAHAVYLQGKIWPTVEHYYQARKFVDSNRDERIRTCATPIAAKRQAERWTDQHRDDWPSIKEDVMYQALWAKFTQHPQLHEMLLRTGDRPLVEHSELDAYWGDGSNGTGKNRLGALLMRLRDELLSRARDNSGIE